MKRWMMVLVPVLLSGCVHDVGMWGDCKDATSQGLIGQRYDKDMRGKLRGRTHAFKVRVVRPGEAVTMDYMKNRVTVTLDERGLIASVRCG
ncbi:I78 family peptidase inhibitor [Sphingomonas sp.]|uniref:I78 family peptidase inhibitor n=1 Tax=Sphingomonas sp. TaxID=28214 RepID=UPI002CC56CAC|nr:I78 family peptidase inhibitor [Sphingomonas sp.]HWK36307.1 I78 family peptidase inhibitor [Sphingomonas sp.]